AFKLTKLHSTHFAVFVRTSDNRLYSWGLNVLGQCGVGVNSYQVSEPTLVAFGYKNDSIKEVVVGEDVCAILAGSNRVYLWGGFRPKITKPTVLNLRKM